MISKIIHFVSSQFAARAKYWSKENQLLLFPAGCTAMPCSQCLSEGHHRPAPDPSPQPVLHFASGGFRPGTAAACALCPLPGALQQHSSAARWRGRGLRLRGAAGSSRWSPRLARALPGCVFGADILAGLCCFPFLAHWNREARRIQPVPLLVQRCWFCSGRNPAHSAALQHAGRGTVQKILWKNCLLLEQSRGRLGRWSNYICSASSTVFAGQKKASGDTESPKQSSRWMQTWPNFLICCISVEVEENLGLKE